MSARRRGNRGSGEATLWAIILLLLGFVFFLYWLSQRPDPGLAPLAAPDARQQGEAALTEEFHFDFFSLLPNEEIAPPPPKQRRKRRPSASPPAWGAPEKRDAHEPTGATESTSAQTAQPLDAAPSPQGAPLAESASPQETAPAPSTPRDAWQPAAPAAHYAIQVGRLHSLEDADRIKAELTLLGIPKIRIIPVNVPGADPLDAVQYGVILGPYDDAARAAEIQQRLRAGGYQSVLRQARR